MSATITSNTMLVEAGTEVICNTPAAEDDHGITWTFVLSTDIGSVAKFYIGGTDNAGTDACAVSLEVRDDPDAFTYRVWIHLYDSDGVEQAKYYLDAGIMPTTIYMCLRHERLSCGGLYIDVGSVGRYFGVAAEVTDLTVNDVSVERVTAGDDDSEEGDPTGNCKSCWCMTTVMYPTGISIAGIVDSHVTLSISGADGWPEGEYTLAFAGFPPDSLDSHSCYCGSVWGGDTEEYSVAVYAKCDGTLILTIIRGGPGGFSYSSSSQGSAVSGFTFMFDADAVVGGLGQWTLTHVP